MKEKVLIARTCKLVIGMELFILEGNREVRQDHVRSIKRAMLAGAHFPPLEVDSIEKYIIDGQHRYLAAKELWDDGIEYPLLVHFYESENPLMDAIKFNNTQITWNLCDFVDAHIASENENYVKLKEWLTSKPLLKSLNPSNPYKYESAVVMFGQTRKQLKEGLFVFPEDTKIADAIYDELAMFKDNRMFYKAFVKAWRDTRAYCLYDMPFTTYYKLWKERFVYPDVEIIEEIENAFKKVIM